MWWPLVVPSALARFTDKETEARGSPHRPAPPGSAFPDFRQHCAVCACVHACLGVYRVYVSEGPRACVLRRVPHVWITEWIRICV